MTTSEEDAKLLSQNGQLDAVAEEPSMKKAKLDSAILASPNSLAVASSPDADETKIDNSSIQTRPIMAPVEDRECLICLCPLQAPFVTPCKHEFCYVCMSQLMSRSGRLMNDNDDDDDADGAPRQGFSCPICRSPVYLSTLMDARMDKSTFLSNLNQVSETFVWQYSSRDKRFWMYSDTLSAEIERAYALFEPFQNSFSELDYTRRKELVHPGLPQPVVYFHRDKPRGICECGMSCHSNLPQGHNRPSYCPCRCEYCTHRCATLRRLGRAISLATKIHVAADMAKEAEKDAPVPSDSSAVDDSIVASNRQDPNAIPFPAAAAKSYRAIKKRAHLRAFEANVSFLHRPRQTINVASIGLTEEMDDSKFECSLLNGTNDSSDIDLSDYEFGYDEDGYYSDEDEDEDEDDDGDNEDDNDTHGEQKVQNDDASDSTVDKPAETDIAPIVYNLPIFQCSSVSSVTDTANEAKDSNKVPSLSTLTNTLVKVKYLPPKYSPLVCSELLDIKFAYDTQKAMKDTRASDEPEVTNEDMISLWVPRQVVSQQFLQAMDIQHAKNQTQPQKQEDSLTKDSASSTVATLQSVASTVASPAPLVRRSSSIIRRDSLVMSPSVDSTLNSSTDPSDQNNTKDDASTKSQLGSDNTVASVDTSAVALPTDKVEMSVKKSLAFTSVFVGAEEYGINFIEMVQFPLSKPRFVRSIRRVQKQTLESSADIKGVSGVRFT